MYFLQFRAGRSTTETTINNPPGTTNIKRKCTMTKVSKNISIKLLGHLNLQWWSKNKIAKCMILMEKNIGTPECDSF